MTASLLLAAGILCGPGLAVNGARVQVAVFMSVRPELVRARHDRHTSGTGSWTELLPDWEAIGVDAARRLGGSLVFDDPTVIQVGGPPWERWRWARGGVIVDPPELVEVCVIALPLRQRLDDLVPAETKGMIK